MINLDHLKIKSTRRCQITETRTEELYSVRVEQVSALIFDVKETRGKDLYMTITESKRNFDNDGNIPIKAPAISIP